MLIAGIAALSSMIADGGEGMKFGVILKFASCAVLRRGLWAVLWLCMGNTAQAQLLYGDVIEGGYSNCSFTQLNGRLNVSFTVQFKAVFPLPSNLPNAVFVSRAFLFFAYDAKGKQKLISVSAIDGGVNLNGSGVSQYLTQRSDSLMIYASAYDKHWMNSDAFTANVRTPAVSKSVISEWPALGIQAANVIWYRGAGVNTPMIQTGAGTLYVGAGVEGCRLINPTQPPPSPVMTEIKVTAPDWDLGELERGKETTRTFATDAQRLCFSYDPKYIDYDKYLISASNRNGVAGNRFQLAGLTDPGERVPYTLSLAGGGDPVALPSADGLSLTLGKSGTTCLTPTFKAWAGADVKEGDFSDVLTFTIVTKP
jgi:hypothetical protein